MDLTNRLPGPPPTEALEDAYTGQMQYRVRCPWCQYDTEWCIWWVAAWGLLSDHVIENHRAVHDVVRARWGMRPIARDRRDKAAPTEPSDS